MWRGKKPSKAHLFKKQGRFLKNPAILKRTSFEVRPSSKLKQRLYQIICFILFAFLVYFLVFHSYFQIGRVVVIGTQRIQDSKITEEVNSIISQPRFLVIPGKNIFFFNKKRVETDLLKNLPEIESVKISRKFPDVIKLYIKEVEPRAIWQSKDKSYYLDKNGIIFSEIDTAIEGSDLPRIVDNSEKEASIRGQVLFAKHIIFITKLYEELPKAGIEISNAILPSPLAEEVHIKTKEGWEIYFSFEREVSRQINNLKVVLTKELKNQTEQLEYVDLRVENWVYYKKK